MEMIEPYDSSAETLDEKQLKELLATTVTNLEPGPGYSLTLEGVPAGMRLHNSLEAFFGISLDQVEGANIELAYDETSAQMILKRLEYPVLGAPGKAILEHTELIGYVPHIKVRQRIFAKNKKVITYEGAATMLQEFGIDSIPQHDHAAYIQWKSELLAMTRGWQLSEELEVPIGFDGVTEQAVTLNNRESFSPNLLAMFKTQTFTESTIQYDAATESADHIDRVLVLHTDPADQLLQPYTQTYRTSTTPNLFGDPPVATQLSTIPVLLTTDICKSFNNSLQQIAAMRRDAA